SQIVDSLGTEAKQLFFGWQVAIVNAIAFSVGLGYIVVTRWQTFRTLSQIAGREPPPGPIPLDVVRRCLRLGAATAGISACLWAISGFVFPTWLRFGAGGESLISAEQYMHFVVSQMLCGLIAATQSYYVVTFLAVRIDYPWLLQG